MSKYISRRHALAAIARELGELRGNSDGTATPTAWVYRADSDLSMKECREWSWQYREQGFQAIDHAAWEARELAWMQRTGRV